MTFSRVPGSNTRSGVRVASGSTKMGVVTRVTERRIRVGELGHPALHRDARGILVASARWWRWEPPCVRRNEPAAQVRLHAAEIHGNLGSSPTAAGNFTVAAEAQHTADTDAVGEEPAHVCADVKAGWFFFTSRVVVLRNVAVSKGYVSS